MENFDQTLSSNGFWNLRDNQMHLLTLTKAWKTKPVCRYSVMLHCKLIKCVPICQRFFVLLQRRAVQKLRNFKNYYIIKLLTWNILGIEHFLRLQNKFLQNRMSCCIHTSKELFQSFTVWESPVPFYQFIICQRRLDGNSSILHKWLWNIDELQDNVKQHPNL